MPDTIVQLDANDFDPAMDFLDRVFAEHRPHDFRKLQPTIYQPTDEHMRRNYAVKRHGDLKAIVGVFPITQHVGDVTLRIAGIGGVAVDPACRGEGLMRLLMDHAVAEIDRAGYDLSWLGGQRQRYRYWGYEVGGTSLRFAIDGRALKHDLLDATPVTLHEVTSEHDPALPAIRSLHDSLPVRCDRPGPALLHHLRTHERLAWSARNAAGQTVGYASTDPHHTTTGELAGATVPETLGIVRAVTQECGSRWAYFHLPAVITPLVHALSACADETCLTDAGNWRINRWARVIDAWLKLRCVHEPLPDEAVTIAIQGADTVRLTVETGVGRCTSHEGPPDVQATPEQALRLLFGPGSPASIMPLHRSAAILHAWCPLPLSLPRQDHV